MKRRRKGYIERGRENEKDNEKDNEKEKQRI